ncbi:MAG: phenylalanine--tRNA ligase subunit beta [Thermoleophilia bacterium]|nr:phenylalanine--tRNA ligase subunit beta [Thermoleophilia bacterium]
MKVPVSWLREYVRVDASTEAIAERLSVSTCEVERIVRRGVRDEDGNLGLFRVGRVLEAAKHPDADRLQVCRVDVGDGEPRQIVCGAWNFGPGATVAVALPGATLPGGLRLERRELRGQVSDGMILAEDEVELGTDHSGIMILDGALPIGTPLADVLPLVDEVLEVETTPNRPDLLSVYGIAREVAALFDGELAAWPGREPARAGDEPVPIAIEDPEGCPRYIGRLFRDAAIAPSPVWLKARLLAAGMRPISNVVDVTNYVMLALGNPLHAFDWDTVRGGVVVRRARDGERLTTLDGQLRDLDPRDLLIADHERAVALAAVMGGEESEVTDGTTSLLLEAANFEPVTVLRTSERLALRTEGSNRWEKGVDPHLAEHAARLATELIVELAGARWTGVVDVHAGLPEPPRVTLRPERTSTVLGFEVAASEQHEILARLGFELDGRVRVPTWRARDVTREIDLVEEVARFKLDEVPFTFPARRELYGRLDALQKLRRLVEDVLVGCGLDEAYTPSLVAGDPDPDALRPSNPMTAEQAILRTTLVPSLFEAASRNREIGNEDVALFEIARVYLPGGDLASERRRVAAVLAGDYLDAKGVVETLLEALKLEPVFERGKHELLHPGKTASLAQGVVGELHPWLGEGWAAFELDLETLLDALSDRVLYQEVIPFPAVRQDLAFVVDEDVPVAAVLAAAREASPDLREIRVFDVYRGGQIADGRKSIAFRVAFQSPERTLSDEDARRIRERIVQVLADRFRAELRA